MEGKIPIDLSVVVPVFNEELGLEFVVKRIRSELKELIGGKYEIVLVDDGSSDKSRLIINNLKNSCKEIKSVFHKTNQGIGSAIYSGIKRAKYQYITFLPADGQIFLSGLKSALEVIPQADLVITYRKRREDYSFYRRLVSKGLTFSMKLFFGLNFRDYSWVQVYRIEIFSRIKPKSKGVFFLPEVIVLGNKNKLRIVEKESPYHPRISGRSKNIKLKVIFKSIKELLLCWIGFKR